MFKLDTIGLKQSVIASLGALLLSTTFVGAAVAPAQAQVEPVPAQTCLLVSHA